jgi:hypothetical protein
VDQARTIPNWALFPAGLGQMLGQTDTQGAHSRRHRESLPEVMDGRNDEPEPVTYPVTYPVT